jgi:hypothetical protein
MDTNGLAKRAGALVAVAICSACGSGSAVALSPSAPLTGVQSDLSALPKTFEYISNYYGAGAAIFDYPKGDTQVGTISGVGGQACANVLYGNGKSFFWIVAGNTAIKEFQVPKKPIKTLSESAGSASSCAMNTAGDLAVGMLNNGEVVIFKNASGSGITWSTPLTKEGFDGYDAHGDLFADGFNSSNKFALVELPEGAKKFETITTSNTVMYPGSVQWDGTYLTVFDQLIDRIYRYTISGTTATLEDTVSLHGPSDCAQTWIGKGVVFCADAGNDDGEVFNYPAGGSEIAVLTGKLETPLGVVSAEK